MSPPVRLLKTVRLLETLEYECNDQIFDRRPQNIFEKIF